MGATRRNRYGEVAAYMGGHPSRSRQRQDWFRLAVVASVADPVGAFGDRTGRMGLAHQPEALGDFQDYGESRPSI